jgi:hypothetical protein
VPLSSATAEALPHSLNETLVRRRANSLPALSTTRSKIRGFMIVFGFRRTPQASTRRGTSAGQEFFPLASNKHKLVSACHHLHRFQEFKPPPERRTFIKLGIVSCGSLICLVQARQRDTLLPRTCDEL